MPNDTRLKLLNEISNFSTDDVVALLQKNELSECCKAVVKRQVDGKGLLHLSEGNLNLWKRDLTISSCRSLCRFVAELNNNPEQYFQDDNRSTSPLPDDSDAESTGSGSWATEFEDDEPSGSECEDFEDCNGDLEAYRNGNSSPQSRTSPGISGNGASRLAQEAEENDNTYPNETSNSRASNNGSNCTVAQMAERLQLNIERRKPPIIGPKPKLIGKTSQVIELLKNKQFLPPPQQPLRLEIKFEKPTPSPGSTENIDSPKVQQSNRYPLPPKPLNASRIIQTPDKKPPSLPKPPSNLVCLPDLEPVADLSPYNCEESDEYDYEPIKEQQYQVLGSTKSTGSSQSLASVPSIRGSNESVHHTQNTSNVEDNQGLYEVIAHKVFDLNYSNDDSYVPPITGPSASKTAPETASKTLPWTIPPRPSPTVNCPKRPYGTCPNISQSSRPLPPTPISDLKLDRQVQPPEIKSDSPSYKTRPWFHNVGREEAISLIEGASTKFSTAPPDGYFLLRPSSTNTDQPWTLVLRYRNKVYNIPVRERLDSRFALGKVKPKELSFSSIEEMVDFYKKEELVLNSGSGDPQVGKTRLTETPPRKKD